MQPVSNTIPEPIRIFPEEQHVEQIEPVPSIPYGYEDTKDWSWR